MKEIKKDFIVYYRRDSNFKEDVTLTREQVILEKTHVMLFKVKATTILDVFNQMQQENWPRNARVHQLLRDKGLHHSSMSIGDCVMEVSTGKIFECDLFSWREIFNEPDVETKNNLIQIPLSQWEELPDEHKGVVRDKKYSKHLGKKTVVSGCISGIIGRLLLEGSDFEIIKDY